MAVAYDAVSESHTGSSGSISQASFTWNHVPSGTPRGILVYTFNSSVQTDRVTAVTYGGVPMIAVTGGLAADTAGEAANCKAYFLGEAIPTGTQAVVVTRTNNTNELYAVAISVTANSDTEVTGTTLQQENQAPAQASIDDGSVSVNSVRFAGAFYGGAGLPGAGANSTAIADIAFGARSIQVVRETTAGSGSRLVGFTNATADDWACVLLAVREVGVIFDAASNSGYKTASASYSWTHTCTGTNLGLFVGVSMLSVLGSSVSGITYAGINLIMIGAVASVSGAVRSEIWFLPNPATGANSIAVTLTASLDSIGNAASFTGVHQAYPIEAFASATTTNVGAADATVNVTTVSDNDIVIDNVATDDTSITVGAGQTSRNNITGTLGSGAMSTEGRQTPAGAVTMSWTNVGAAATWSTVAVGIVPVSTIALLSQSVI